MMTPYRLVVKPSPPLEMLSFAKELWAHCLSTKVDSLPQHILIKFSAIPFEFRRLIPSFIWRNRSPMTLVIQKGLVNILDYFRVVCGVDVANYHFEIPEIKESSLHIAVAFGSLNIVQYLLKEGADPNIRRKTDKSTPLFLVNESLDITKVLVSFGAKMNIRNNRGMSPFLQSVDNAHVCEYFLDNDADIQESDGCKNTALHLAVAYGNYESVRMLVERGADLLAVNQQGQDPLTTAALAYNDSIVDYLMAFYPVHRQIEACELFGK